MCLQGTVTAHICRCTWVILLFIPSFNLLNPLSPVVEELTVLSSCLYEFLFWESAAARNAHVLSA